MKNQELLSPEAPRFPRTDSLVFSITAQKDNSPHDTDLLRQSIPNDSKEITLLNNKLDILENKVKEIKTQRDQYFSDAIQYSNIQKENIDISNLTLGDENFAVGRFHKNIGKATPKVCGDEYSSYHTKTKRINAHYQSNNISHESRESVKSRKQFSLQRQSHREMMSMKKQMMKLKLKAQRSERSRSQCSQKLSQSRQNIKNLKKQKQINERLIGNLVKELKKSENIRKKQKQIVGKQKKQIQQLKKLVNVLKASIKV